MRMRVMCHLGWALLLGARLTAAQAPTQAGLPSAALPASVDDGVRLGPGDILRVTVWRRPEMSGDCVVGDDGLLNHPLYRTVSVTGIPMSTVEARMRAFLKRFNDDPQFAIEAMVRVSVTGEVRNANVYTLSPRTTIAQAVEMAGGVTDRGRRDDVLLLRSGRTNQVDLARPEAGFAQAPVRSGNQIIVRRHVDFFREYLAPGAAVAAAIAAILNASQGRR